MKLMVKSSPSKRPAASQLMDHSLLYKYKQSLNQVEQKKEVGKVEEDKRKENKDLSRMNTLVSHAPLTKPNMKTLREDLTLKKIEERETISNKTTGITRLDTEDGNVGIEDTEILDEGGIGNSLKKYSGNNKVLEVNKQK